MASGIDSATFSGSTAAVPEFDVREIDPEVLARLVAEMESSLNEPEIGGIVIAQTVMPFSDYLESALNGGVNNVEQQKFQYGGYNEFEELHTWEEVLATDVVTDNGDGSVTLSSSADVPRVQFYPDDGVEPEREMTQVSDLTDVQVEFDILNWEEGKAAWMYELHNDGQAFALGVDEEGKLMLKSDGEDISTDITFHNAGGFHISYEGNQANVTVFNKDGSIRRDAVSVDIPATEVHVKGIEVYNKKSAADTELSVKYSEIMFTGTSLFGA